ncbi:hypothetical protein GOP47_0012015 [Adiantum capillus-veneris]|uniref:Uncharacterized protein n=1 Tax=Adiantum capillus-veneris TaxID=13818 RepID=A0A9D4ZHC0_ADICA|nr:hypothetical protein GOP47_0012015 [Adiantum capillus-veneris]
MATDEGSNEPQLATGLLSGRHWKRPAEYLILEDGEHIQEELDYLPFTLMSSITLPAQQDVQRLRLSPVGQEEEKRDDLASDQCVLLDASMEVAASLDPDMHQIEELPSSHILLKEGQIANPLVQRAVKHHVVTLGIPWQDAAVHLPALLATLPPSTPLRHLLLFNDDNPEFNVSSYEIHEILKALQSTSSPLVDGVVFSRLNLEFLLNGYFDRQLSQVLCSSLTYLGIRNHRELDEVDSGILMGALAEGLQNQLCKVKQLLLGGLNIGFDAITCLRQILQRPNCTLTRLDLRGCNYRSEIFLNLLLVDIMANNKSLTDLGLPMPSRQDMQVFVDSRLHTRVLTLRLDLWGEVADLWNLLILQGLADSACTIQFLDCQFHEWKSSMWRTLSQSDVSAAALRALRIVLPPGRASGSAAGLADYVSSPAASNLVYLEVRIDADKTGLSQADSDEWECANSLINNFSICTLAFPWQNGAAEAHAASLIRRNQLYRESQLLKEPHVKPNVAKLFLCGHAEVGKTTLCQALHYTWPLSSIGRSCGLYHRPERTRGMEFHSLAFRRNHKKLLICDLAGQEEYHVFHHYFMNASNNDIFIVVCKVDNSSSLQEFALQLDYWLRFIVSHRSARKKTLTSSDVDHVESKPKVIVVVNFFEQGKPSDAIRNITHSWTSTLMNKFSVVLDFAVHAEKIGHYQNLFGVNARTALGVQRLKRRLESLLRDFDNAAWPIPKLCYDISAQLTKGSQTNWLCHRIFGTGQSESRLLTSYSSVLEMLSEKSHVEIDSTRVQAALQELHIQGYVVFFPSEEMEEAVGKSHSMKRDSVCEDNIMSTLVITDIAWFCNKLVGSLLGTHIEGEPKRPCPWVWVKEDIKNMLRRQGCKETHLEEILRYLEHLELCISLDSAPGQPKGNLLFPALVKEKEIRYPSVCNGKDTTFFGRRLRCRDSSIHLIPFGVFTRLQVKLHKVYCANNKSFNVGYGWVSFMRGNVGVVVRFGGDVINEAWESKQWIDILIFCPDSLRYNTSSSSSMTTAGGYCTKPIDDPSFIAGNKLMDEIRTLIYATCKTADFGGIPTVMLEEWVLQSKEPCSDAAPLSSILEKVRSEGLLEVYQEWGINIGPTPVVNLLLPKEIEDRVKGRFSVLAGIEEEFSLSGLGGGEDQEQELKHEESHGSGKQLTGELQDLLECIKFEVRSSEKRQQKMLQKLNSNLRMIRTDIQKLGDVLRQAERDIIANCSTRLLRNELRNDRAYPLFPYLVDVTGKLAPLKALFGKRAVVHFMCESPTEGPHLVEGQSGKEVTMELKGWVMKVARVMVPAVRVICCLARLAASVYLPSAQVFIPSPEAMVSGLGIEREALQHVILAKALEALLEQMPDVDYRHFLTNTEEAGMLHKNEAKEVMQIVLAHVEVDMAFDFGLHRVCFDDVAGNTFWVCDRHAHKGELLVPIGNPYNQGKRPL